MQVEFPPITHAGSYAAIVVEVVGQAQEAWWIKLPLIQALSLNLVVALRPFHVMLATYPHCATSRRPAIE
ncbi:hypothetical protein D7U89_22310 [Stenotrophomonas maltophilia]|nr:hypothetical protein [Stenotrophomonas maltophilia]MBA0369032.1 hypothetical protein [Stenotrophomonas maltophilia]MBA0402933.1 hypothetical protein [Stenotrophomonas maltophilia]